jgi:NO-binding membrane sensor protein with MHYT domain
MDSTKVVIALFAAFIALVGMWMGFKFVSDHWNDIKELATIALVLGVGFSVVIGGLKLRAGR